MFLDYNGKKLPSLVLWFGGLFSSIICCILISRFIGHGPIFHFSDLAGSGLPVCFGPYGLDWFPLWVYESAPGGGWPIVGFIFFTSVWFLYVIDFGRADGKMRLCYYLPLFLVFVRGVVYYLSVRFFTDLFVLLCFLTIGCVASYVFAYFRFLNVHPDVSRVYDKKPLVLFVLLLIFVIAVYLLYAFMFWHLHTLHTGLITDLPMF